MNNDDLRYPIGKFAPQESYTDSEVKSNIARIEKIPAEVEKLVSKFTSSQWETPYRDGGWTARQVVHHMADSHLNAYMRLKWTLTESTPLIKAYDEKAWAETPETKLDPANFDFFSKSTPCKMDCINEAYQAGGSKERIYPSRY